MKRLVLHVKRLFKKFWFIIFFAFAISIVHGIALLVIMLTLSMLFFSDPVDVNAILDNFTEDELDIILAETVDEKVSDDDYLNLLARYQTFFCPKKFDSVTVWTGSMVTKEAYIYDYELKREVEAFNKQAQKERIMGQIDLNCVQVKRLLSSNRNMIFRYTYRNTGETLEIVINTDELKG